MNRKELIDVVTNIESVEQISFFTSDNKVSNRFDLEEKEKKKHDDYLLDISYTIYSYIVSSIIFKAQGKESQEKGLSFFEKEFDSLVSKQKADIREETRLAKDTALHLIKAFFNGTAKILIQDMMAKFAPLAVIKTMDMHPNEAKHIMKLFSKHKETVFNQTLLFSRSILHSFFNKEGISSNRMHPDYDALGNGLFSYDSTTLIIPTALNAFTLENYKSVIIDGLNIASKNMPLGNISSFCVIYLTKDICAKYDIK